jgi:hypothetical protein
MASAVIVAREKRRYMILNNVLFAEKREVKDFYEKKRQIEMMYVVYQGKCNRSI